MADTADTLANSFIIKKSMVHRAKFLEEENTCFLPHEVVPHPSNRGGDDIKVPRLQSLTGSLACFGVDLVEANSNSVCVSVPPDAVGGEPDFQAAFEKRVICPDEMAIDLMRAKVGSFSHSHLNCTLRNVISGKIGCRCERSAVAEGGNKCPCGNAIVCDAQGR